MAYFRKFKAYHLIAHSYGSYIALKLAEKLESGGKAGRITFVDAAPALIKNMLLARHEHSTDEQIQNSVIETLVLSVWDNNPIDVKSVLSLPTWDEKVNQVLMFVADQQLYGKEYLRLMFNALLNRVKVVLSNDLKITSLTKSKATLIRPNIPWVLNINEKYDLQLNFKEEVKLLFLDGNHFTILENPLLLDTLNKIHSEFEK